MGITSLFYRATGQTEKYENQLASERQEKLDEGKTRLDNLRDGKPANDHHGIVSKTVASFVDGYAGFGATHTLYAAGAGLVATSLVIATPPIGFSILGVSALGIVADRATGAHEERKGLRDVERYLGVLEKTEERIKEKAGPGVDLGQDPTIMRIHAARENLLEEYTDRFAKKEGIPAADLRKHIDPNTPQHAGQGHTAEEEKESVLGAAKEKAVFANAWTSNVIGVAGKVSNTVAMLGSVTGVLDTAIGAVARVNQVAGRSSWDVRIANAGFATEVLACIADAKSEHGVDMKDQKSAISKIQGQADRPQKYIKEWEKTGTALDATKDSKSALEELVSKVERGEAKPEELKAALKEFGKEAAQFKDPMILGTDRLKIWQKNPIKELASDMEKLSKADPNNLDNIKAMLEKMDGRIEKAQERNDKLVGDEYKEKAAHGAHAPGIHAGTSHDPVEPAVSKTTPQKEATMSAETTPPISGKEAISSLTKEAKQELDGIRTEMSPTKISFPPVESRSTPNRAMEEGAGRG